MAMCVIAVVGAPCQCFSPGSIHTTSPGRDVRDGAAYTLHVPETRRDDQRLTKGMRVPCGAGARLERDDGPETRAGASLWNGESTRTWPVKYSDGPRLEGCEPFLVMFMFPPRLERCATWRQVASMPAAIRHSAAASPIVVRLLLQNVRLLTAVLNSRDGGSRSANAARTTAIACFRSVAGP
jgi:hypothetical protein